jgi:hypothetical protein
LRDCDYSDNHNYDRQHRGKSWPIDKKMRNHKKQICPTRPAEMIFSLSCNYRDAIEGLAISASTG